MKLKKHVCNPNRPHLFIISCVQKCKFPSKDFHWQQSEESVWTSECMSLKGPTTISQLKNFIGNVQRWNRYWISNAETLICCLYIHKQAMVRKNSINKWKQHRKEWRKKISISLKNSKLNCPQSCHRYTKKIDYQLLREQSGKGGLRLKNLSIHQRQGLRWYGQIDASQAKIKSRIEQRLAIK